MDLIFQWYFLESFFCRNLVYILLNTNSVYFIIELKCEKNGKKTYSYNLYLCTVGTGDLSCAMDIHTFNAHYGLCIPF